MQYSMMKNGHAQPCYPRLSAIPGNLWALGSRAIECQRDSVLAGAAGALQDWL